MRLSSPSFALRFLWTEKRVALWSRCEARALTPARLQKQPVTDWSNDDFDESSGKFRSKRNGGPAAGDDDGDDDSSDDDEGATVRDLSAVR